MENNTMRDVKVRNGAAVLQGCTNCTVYVINSTGESSSVEEQELLAIYRRLPIRAKVQLIQAAIDLEEGIISG